MLLNLKFRSLTPARCTFSFSWRESKIWFCILSRVGYVVLWELNFNNLFTLNVPRTLKYRILLQNDYLSCQKYKLWQDKRRPHLEKKKCSVKIMAKLNEMDFNLLAHPRYFPDQAPSDYWRFADLKKIH